MHRKRLPLPALSPIHAHSQRLRFTRHLAITFIVACGVHLKSSLQRPRPHFACKSSIAMKCARAKRRSL